MRKARQHFTTIRTEGGILPPDILLRVAELDKSLGGLTPDEYHLPSGDRINEAISRAWSLLVPAWKSFRKEQLALPAGDVGTRLTRDKWLLPLFQQLGYGRLTARGAVRAREREYPISHGWEQSPIHLVGCNIDLDTRTAGVAGAAKSSPHSLVQVFLNESEAHRWGFLSNGLRLQILRDNASLARKAFVEFDLQAMMDGEVYADFRILWLLCHQSRVEPKGGSAIDCWLEKWTKVAQDEGTRALDTLRNGVEDAIRILGRGFVSHPANTELKDRLRTGSLDQQDYYRQLLRVVYRLLFLFIAEDRGGLLKPDADEAAKSRYLRYYSVDRFRTLVEAGTPGSPHADLWHGLSVVFNALESDGASSLGLPALGSFLWSHTSTPDLLGPAQASVHRATPAVVSNAHLLAAVKALAFVVDEHRRRPIDYKNLGHEELGSVYESLLELHPRINMDATREDERFVLSSAAGNERKTSGSYYTPDSLVQCLLDSALEPVAAEAIKGKGGKDAEEAILDLKVCDPACGSGHFLIAAARRLALKLARIRTGDEEPSPESIRQSLRDVVRRCIYGVDLNPMAVELCKVALWVESLEPGKPLTFLDAHIKCGNSLLGTTPKLMAGGIPDDAFEPLTGDDKKVVSYYKKRNKQERKDIAGGQRTLLDDLRDKFDIKLGNMPAMLASMVKEEEDDIAAVRRHEQQYADAVRGTAYENARLLADAWCAAFVWRKHDTDAPGSVPGFPGNWDAITEQVYREIERNPHSVQPWIKEEIKRLAADYRFFHSHLDFPEVFAHGGFQCILGNPPWEMMELSEKEYFAQLAPEIAQAPSARIRQSLIEALQSTSPAVFEAYTAAKRANSGFRSFVQTSGVFPTSSTGRINLYPLFVEKAVNLIASSGRLGLIVPSAISMDAYNAPLFMTLVTSGRLASLYDFENSDGLFPGVHSSYRLCLLTCCGERPADARIDFCYFAKSIDDLRRPDRRTSLNAEQIAVFSPNTLAPPMLTNEKDAVLALLIYTRLGVLNNHKRPSNSGWAASIQRMLSLSDPGDLFRLAQELGDAAHSEEWTRLYCGKAIHQYDHRFATWDEQRWRPFGPERHEAPAAYITTEYFVRTAEVKARLADKPTVRWLLSYRDVCRATDERTVIAAVVPPAGCDTTCRNIYLAATAREYCLFAANINSFCFDYFARQKVIGIHLGAGVFEQLPVLSRAVFELRCKWSGTESTVSEWLLARALELLYTAWDLEAFSADCDLAGPPFHWDEDRRFHIRCELDAAFFHLYMRPDEHGEWSRTEHEAGESLERLKQSFPTPRDAVSYVLDTFPIIRRKDEERHGEYRTKRMILEIFDALQESSDTASPYRTRLDPPPGDARARHDPGKSPPPPASGGSPSTASPPRHSEAPNASRREKPGAKRGSAIVDAFLSVREGRSADFVVCSAELNARFLATARDLGEKGTDAELNRRLLSARKTNRLKDHPTTVGFTLPRQVLPYAFVAEWAARHLQRRMLIDHNEEVSLDDILCDPSLAAEFDECAGRIKPGVPPLHWRWAALAFRKTGRRRSLGTTAAFELRDAARQPLLFDAVPPVAGLYMLTANDRPIYVNETRDLHETIIRHAEVGGGELVPLWLLDKFPAADGVRWAALAGVNPDALHEGRIRLVANERPWLNLVDTLGAA